jgi:hypothetical protein
VIEELSFGYELGKSLLKKATEFYSKYSAGRAQELMRRAQKAYQNPYLTAYLRWKYPRTSLLSAAGQTYPVAIYPSPATQRALPESVLRRPLTRRRQHDDTLLPQSAKYRALAHRLGLDHYDRPCFTMIQIRESPTLSLLNANLVPTFVRLIRATSLLGSSSGIMRGSPVRRLSNSNSSTSIFLSGAASIPLSMTQSATVSEEARRSQCLC